MYTTTMAGYFTKKEGERGRTRQGDVERGRRRCEGLGGMEKRDGGLC